MATKTDKPDGQPQEQPPEEPKASKVASPALATLKFEGAPWTGTLSIGDVSFDVTDGHTAVPQELVERARAAGFLPG